MRGFVSNNYAVYLIENASGVLYAGASTDPIRRLREHNVGRGARFTRGRGPWRIVLCKGWLTKRDALRLELLVKKLRKKDKINFLTNHKAGLLFFFP